jgi:TonB-linked SusC/RagA family outer membrane protein
MRLKYKWIFTLLVALSVQFSFAQEKTVTGVVSDASGTLPGANVVVQGTKTSTQTDINGKYSIKAKAGDVLVFSFVGLSNSTAKVGAGNVYDVKLIEGKVLDVVTVQGYGIKKAKDAVTSSQQIVGNKELIQAASPSVIQSLTGKVSGLQINTTSSGVNGSTRITLRGLRSLTGNAEALVVIDGVISSAQILGQLPPEIVENINVIKGQQGSSIYGDQGSNGVIVVTTKKGNKNSKPVVSVNSSIDFESIAYLPARQDKYGQGWYNDNNFDNGAGFPGAGNPANTHVAFENGSWGPAFADPIWGGKSLPTGLPQADGKFLLLPYSSNKDNILKFFQTGTIYRNGITLNLGGEDGYALISANRQNTEYVVKGDELVKNSFFFKGGKKVGKFSLDGSVNYTAQNVTQSSQNLFFDLLQTATNIPVELYSEGANEHHWTAYYKSPYWKTKNVRFDDSSNIVTANAVLGYEINKNISVSYGLNGILNSTTSEYHNNGFSGDQLTYQYNFSPFAYAGGSTYTYVDLAGAGAAVTSSYYKSNIVRRNIYGDLLVNLNYALTDKIGFKANLGYNIQDNNFSIITVGGTGINKFGIYNVNNLTGQGNVNFVADDSQTPVQFVDFSTRKLDNRISNTRKVGSFINADFNYEDYLFLNTTARYEKSSVVTESTFYPSAGLSFIPTKYFSALKDSKILNYSKIFAAYSVTGNTTAIAAYQTSGSPGNLGIGYPYLGLSSFINPTTLIDQSIRPEYSYTKEVGANFEFLNSRIVLGGSFYNTDVKNLITNSSLPPSTGASFLKGNIGNLQNKGYELDFGLTPIKNDSFRWDIKASYSSYKTIVTELAKDATEILVNGSETTVGIYAVLGEEYPLIKGTSYTRDPNGSIVVNANGIPITNTAFKTLGKVNPDYILGFTNSFEYKGLRLTAVADYRTGNKFYSNTLENESFTGLSPLTADFDRFVGLVIPNSVKLVGGVYVPNTTLVGNGGIAATGGYFSNGAYRTNAENFVLDGTAFRIRELSLAYSLPVKWIEKTGLTSFRFSINARNPFVWFGNPFKNKSSYENQGYGDAESDNTASTANNANGAGINSANQYPSTKTFGFGINLTF